MQKVLQFLDGVLLHVLVGVVMFVLGGLLAGSLDAQPEYGERSFTSSVTQPIVERPCLTGNNCQSIGELRAGGTVTLYGPYVGHDNLIWGALDPQLETWVYVARNGICPVATFGEIDPADRGVPVIVGTPISAFEVSPPESTPDE